MLCTCTEFIRANAIIIILHIDPQHFLLFSFYLRVFISGQYELVPPFQTSTFNQNNALILDQNRSEMRGEEKKQYFKSVGAPPWDCMRRRGSSKGYIKDTSMSCYERGVGARECSGSGALEWRGGRGRAIEGGQGWRWDALGPEDCGREHDAQVGGGHLSGLVLRDALQVVEEEAAALHVHRRHLLHDRRESDRRARRVPILRVLLRARNTRNDYPIWSKPIIALIWLDETEEKRG